jgi:hypothetical protein
MSHGFPISLYPEGIGPSLALCLAKRWEEDEYIPLATEVHGVFEIVMGAYFVGTGCKNGIKSYWDKNIALGVLGIGTPNFFIQGGALIMLKGIFDVARLPCTTIKCGYNLASRSVTALCPPCKETHED